MLFASTFYDFFLFIFVHNMMSEMIEFEEFYKTCLPRLVRLASKYTNNSAAANDIALEAINEYWLRRDDFDSPKAVTSFLNICVKNKSINYIRHIKSKVETKGNNELLNEFKDTIASIDSNSTEIGNDIQKILSTLPDRTARIFHMFFYDKIKQSEIAVKEGISIKSVEYHIRKAKDALRSGLSKDI